MGYCQERKRALCASLPSGDGYSLVKNGERSWEEAGSWLQQVLCSLNSWECVNPPTSGPWPLVAFRGHLALQFQWLDQSLSLEYLSILHRSGSPSCSLRCCGSRSLAVPGHTHPNFTLWVPGNWRISSWWKASWQWCGLFPEERVKHSAPERPLPRRGGSYMALSSDSLKVWLSQTKHFSKKKNKIHNRKECNHVVKEESVLYLESVTLFPCPSE